jgi:hypothetical protein
VVAVGHAAVATGSGGDTEWMVKTSRGSTGSAPEPPTRRALHGVAELLLAGPQYRRSGTIRLRAAAGGFATIGEPAIAVDRGEMVWPGGRTAIDGQTCARLASTIGVAAGAPEGMYAGGSGVDPADELTVDAGAAAQLAGALAVGDAALRRLEPDQTPVLWPEHFDIAISVDEINYGVSTGDAHIDEPYAYVGPWRPRTGPFWNAPFGATRPLQELPDSDAVLAFFTEGRDCARSG